MSDYVQFSEIDVLARLLAAAAVTRAVFEI